jgi:hypothetical protein
MGVRTGWAPSGLRGECDARTVVSSRAHPLPEALCRQGAVVTGEVGPATGSPEAPLVVVDCPGRKAA